MRKYQVSLGQIVNAEYVRNFFENDDIDIFNKTNKIINGCNENEVKIVSKTYGKKGIFERFFNLFSWLYFTVTFVVFNYFWSAIKSNHVFIKSKNY